jgi:hypothetical protein
MSKLPVGDESRKTLAGTHDHRAALVQNDDQRRSVVKAIRKDRENRTPRE